MGIFPQSKCFKGYLCYSVLILSVSIGNTLASNLESRIINGTEVTWNNTRYQVSVRLEPIDGIFYGSGHMCGGSLIAKNVVLTASHCVWNENLRKFRSPSEFSIVMGNVDRTVKSTNTLKLGVSKIITGSNFNETTFKDDIAIMILNSSVPENYTGSSIIALNENRNLAVGTRCVVTGWGMTEKRTYTKKLMSVEVPIISRRVCSINYGRDTIMDGMICAGYMAGERDACSGDSGGPLVCNNKLVGIVSFGFGCALPGYPGIYADVAYYVDWIRNQTGLMKKLIAPPIDPILIPNTTYSTNTTTVSGNLTLSFTISLTLNINSTLPTILTNSSTLITPIGNFTILGNSTTANYTKNSTYSTNSTSNSYNNASSGLNYSSCTLTVLLLLTVVNVYC